MKQKIFHAMTPLGVMEEFIEKQAENGYQLVSIQKSILDIVYCMKFTPAQKDSVLCHLQETEGGLSWEYENPVGNKQTQKANTDKGLMLFVKMNIIASGIILVLWLLLCIAVCVKTTHILHRMAMVFVISLAIFYLLLKAMRTPLMPTKKSKNKENLLAALILGTGTAVVFEVVCQVISFI